MGGEGGVELVAEARTLVYAWRQQGHDLHEVGGEVEDFGLHYEVQSVDFMLVGIQAVD